MSELYSCRNDLTEDSLFRTDLLSAVVNCENIEAKKSAFKLYMKLKKKQPLVCINQSESEIKHGKCSKCPSRKNKRIKKYKKARKFCEHLRLGKAVVYEQTLESVSSVAFM